MLRIGKSIENYRSSMKMANFPRLISIRVSNSIGEVVDSKHLSICLNKSPILKACILSEYDIMCIETVGFLVVL